MQNEARTNRQRRTDDCTAEFTDRQARAPWYEHCGMSRDASTDKHKHGQTDGLSVRQSPRTDRDIATQRHQHTDNDTQTTQTLHSRHKDLGARTSKTTAPTCQPPLGSPMTGGKENCPSIVRYGMEEPTRGQTCAEVGVVVGSGWTQSGC